MFLLVSRLHKLIPLNLCAQLLHTLSCHCCDFPVTICNDNDIIVSICILAHTSMSILVLQSSLCCVVPGPTQLAYHRLDMLPTDRSCMYLKQLATFGEYTQDLTRLSFMQNIGGATVGTTTSYSSRLPASISSVPGSNHDLLTLSVCCHLSRHLVSCHIPVQ